MNIKKELKGYLEAKRERERWMRLLEETEAKLMSVGINYNDVKVQSSPQFDKMADTIIRLNELRNECIDRAHAEVSEMIRISAMIDKVGDARQKDVLTRRYIEGHTWEQIAYEMGYSWRGIHNLHTQALEKCIEVHSQDGV